MSLNNWIKYLVTVLLLVASGKMQGQIDSFLPEANQYYYTNSTVSNVAIDFRQQYIYNNNQDTLFLPPLSKLGLAICQPLKVLATLQLDKKGTKEIVFCRVCSTNTVFYQASYSTEATVLIEKYELWNLDTQKCLFEAVYSYKKKSKKELLIKTRWKQYERSTTFYHYPIKIDAVGNIKIHQLRGNAKHLADHKAGGYQFKEGEYQLMP